MKKLIHAVRRALTELTDQQINDAQWRLGYTKFQTALSSLVRKHLRKSDSSKIGGSWHKVGNDVEIYIGPVYSPNERELEAFANAAVDLIKGFGWVAKLSTDIEDDVGAVTGKLVSQLPPRPRRPRPTTSS